MNIKNKWLGEIYFSLFTISLILSLIEIFTYKNFFFKHFYIHTDVLIGLAVISGMIFIAREERMKTTFLNKMVFILTRGCYAILALTIPLYVYFNLLNLINYPNYVFSKIHIQTDLIIRPIVLCLSLVILLYLQKKHLVSFYKLYKEKTWKNYARYFLTIIIVGIIALYTLVNLIVNAADIIPQTILMINNRNLTRQQKYEYVMVKNYGYFYNYMDFIKSVTPPDASILLPPQKNPWQLEGNQRLVRYFLFPRVLYSAHESNLPASFDYIMIAWGGDSFPPDNSNDYGWPKYPIEAKKIYLYDTSTKNYSVSNDNYDPNKFLKPGTYGLIETK